MPATDDDGSGVHFSPLPAPHWPGDLSLVHCECQHQFWHSLPTSANECAEPLFPFHRKRYRTINSPRAFPGRRERRALGRHSRTAVGNEKGHQENLVPFLESCPSAKPQRSGRQRQPPLPTRQPHRRTSPPQHPPWTSATRRDRRPWCPPAYPSHSCQSQCS